MDQVELISGYLDCLFGVREIGISFEPNCDKTVCQNLIFSSIFFFVIGKDNDVSSPFPFDSIKSCANRALVISGE